MVNRDTWMKIVVDFILSLNNILRKYIMCKINININYIFMSLCMIVMMKIIYNTMFMMNIDLSIMRKFTFCF